MLRHQSEPMVTVRFGGCKTSTTWNKKLYDRSSVEYVSENFLKFVLSNDLLTKMQSKQTHPPTSLGRLTLTSSESDMEYLEKIYQIHLATEHHLQIHGLPHGMIKLKQLMSKAESQALSLYTIYYIRQLFLECLQGKKSISMLAKFVM